MLTKSWNSTGKIGRIGRKKPNVEVTVGLGPMPPDASNFPGGIPAKGVPRAGVCKATSEDGTPGPGSGTLVGTRWQGIFTTL